MKKIARYLVSLLLLLVLASPFVMKSQGCVASFSFSPGPNGQVFFTSTSTGTTPITNYTWTFGVPYISPVTGSGTLASQANVTYTANGTYIVTLNISGNLCASSFTMPVLINNIITPTCTINFTTTAPVNTLCSGSAIVSSSGFCSPVNYTWFPGNIVGPIQGSMCPGTYTVLVSGAATSGSCCPLTASVITIPPPCLLSAQFTQTALIGGVVNFSSTSVGVYTTATYIWDFGDGSANGSSMTATHIYSVAGNYSVTLSVNNNVIPTCQDTVVQPVSAFISTCNLVPNFSSQPIGNLFLSFQSTSTGTQPGSSFNWNFGDGYTSSGAAVTHSYAGTGTYSVQLTVVNNATPTCTSNTVIPVQAFSVICNVTAAFTHTVGSAGVVTFSNTFGSSAVNQFWDFGDGTTAITASPTHTYTNGGTHYVKLVVRDSAYSFCRDSIIQSINITGVSCVANSVFTLVPTGTPKFWNAIPNYPYNVSSAVWSWGDGTSSNGMYTSHVYSVAGTYTICLSVTVSCGASSSYCFPYAISKPVGSGGGSDVYSINVVPPTLQVSVQHWKEESLQVVVFPNPGSGEFILQLDHLNGSGAQMQIYDLNGKIIKNGQFSENGKYEVKLDNCGAGLYFMRVATSQASKTVKLIINN